MRSIKLGTDQLIFVEFAKLGKKRKSYVQNKGRQRKK